MRGEMEMVTELEILKKYGSYCKEVLVEDCKELIAAILTLADVIKES